ncbi:hypothetical protein CVT25_011044 [Psilocybe cyanescens]|uniref:Transglycosylase SLT domain-containing protein n=1 Tax=Psilocybe cyanescens TaxID=93625 RepID=A0A409WF77_PSICY|nr:hypothetical protein CVT25_011044 [Psilocybe cyanescens]
MRLLTSTLALFLSIIVADASLGHENPGLSARHNRLAHRDTGLEARATAGSRRCPNRSQKVTTPVAPNFAAAKNLTSTTNKAASTPAPAPAPPAPVVPAGVINVVSHCGAIGATQQTTALTGPNGRLDWLMCGFETPGGWQPPYVRIQDLITHSLSSALQSPNSPFKACNPYLHIFEKYGQQFGIPAIIMASFSMQESGCNPNTVGGGGEQGMMQITTDKCGGAPGGNCKDPDFNIRTATKFFADTLASNGGNILTSIGAYNGFYVGLTKEKAFAARWSACCRCQNNGDYLHQFVNGWLQNINAYGPIKLGKYFNLDVCPAH